MSSVANFRIGRVTTRDELKCLVRVQFADADALVSYWLPVMQAATRGDRSYRMPAIDEQVACILDERSEFGVVLGAIYSDVDVPPIASLNRVHLAFGDGTTIDYDRSTHQLKVVVAPGGTALVTADHVELGGAGGLALVTAAWLDVFAAHTHPTPGGPSGPPIGGAFGVVPNVTQRVTAQ